jgi:hypothetical protein
MIAMLRIAVEFNDGTNVIKFSEFSPKFSENFICIAPHGTESDEFYNVATIRKITVEPGR